jgi:hypothetical protein
MKKIEKWRMIIQEAKAHPELWRRGEGRKIREVKTDGETRTGGKKEPENLKEATSQA